MSVLLQDGWLSCPALKFLCLILGKSVSASVIHWASGLCCPHSKTGLNSLGQEGPWLHWEATVHLPCGVADY